MGMLLARHYDEVGHASDGATLLKALETVAGELEFGQVSAVLVRGDFSSPGLWVRSVGNPPAGYVEASKDVSFARRDPLLARLMATSVPLAYDQQFYVDAGQAELWEMIAPHGYRTGLGMGMRVGGLNFMIGVDRAAALPKADGLRMRLLADLQLLGLHAHRSMSKLFQPPVAANEPIPTLTKREREALQWTADGKTAWVTGQLMGITERGVNFHLQAVMRKLGVRSKEIAVLKCIEGGLLSR